MNDAMFYPAKEISPHQASEPHQRFYQEYQLPTPHKNREDVLDANLFFSLQQVRELTEKWQEDYNHERPHEALNFKTPAEYEAA